MTTIHTTPQLPELLDITQVAMHLGVNVRHVRRLIAERRIPFVKWGHLIRFDPDEIVDWLDHNRRCADPRPEAVMSQPTRMLAMPDGPRRSLGLDDSTHQEIHS